MEALESIHYVYEAPDNEFRFTCDYVHRIPGIGIVASGMLHSGSISTNDGVVYVTPKATAPIPVKTIEHMRKKINSGVGQAGQFISINVRCTYVDIPRRSILLKRTQAISLPKKFTGTFIFLGAPGFKQLSAGYTPSFHFNINNSPARLFTIHSILQKGKVVKVNPSPAEIVTGTSFSATFELLLPTHVETFKQSKTFGSCVVNDNFHVPMVGIVTGLSTEQFALNKQFVEKTKFAPQVPLASGRMTKGAGRP